MIGSAEFSMLKYWIVCPISHPSWKASRWLGAGVWLIINELSEWSPGLFVHERVPRKVYTRVTKWNTAQITSWHNIDVCGSYRSPGTISISKRYKKLARHSKMWISFLRSRIPSFTAISNLSLNAYNSIKSTDSTRNFICWMHSIFITFEIILKLSSLYARFRVIFLYLW